MKHELKTMKLAELKPADYNPRTITPEALEGLKASLNKFGNVQYIVWNSRTGNIVSGHQRVKALLALGQVETDVIVVDLSESDEIALNVTQNNPHISGTFTDALQPILEDLKYEIEEFEDLKLDVLEMTEIPVAPTIDKKEAEITKCPKCGYEWTEG